MLKLIVALCTVFSLSWAEASDREDYLKDWDVVLDHSEKATNPAEYKVLQKKYPQYFQNYSAEEVTLATVRHLAFRFKGETTCAPGDTRLYFETVSYGLCRKVNGKSRCLVGSPGALPVAGDPCEVIEELE